jgi:hypothetical protein
MLKAALHTIAKPTAYLLVFLLSVCVQSQVDTYPRDTLTYAETQGDTLTHAGRHTYIFPHICAQDGVR